MNVLFKRGLSSALPSSGAVEGAFYLTTDTNRLYIGKKMGTASDSPVVPVELNQSITIKANLAAAQAVTNALDALDANAKANGQFFYLENENILAVYKDGTWIQINPDTDTNDNTKVVNVTGHETSIVRDTSDTTNITFNYTISQKTIDVDGADTYETPITGSFSITPNDVAALAGVAVDVGATVSNSTATVSTSGTGAAANGHGFTITGGENVEITGSNNALTINATDTTYTLGSAANSTSIALNDGSTNTGSVNFGGTQQISVTGANADTISIGHSNSSVTAGSYGVSTSTSPAAGTGKIKVPNITVDAQGHITAASDQEISLPEDNDTYITGIAAAANGNVTVTRNNNSSFTTNTDWLYYTIGQYNADGTLVGGEDTKVYNQGDLGDYYTKAAIDQKLQGLDALRYKGTVGTAPATVQSLPLNPENGDTYKVATAGTYGSIACEVGDLLIATGEEGNDGTISSPTWTLVSTGEDTDTTYTFGVNTSTPGLTVTPSTGGVSTFATIAGGNALTASASGTTITIDHDTSSVTAGSKGLSADDTPNHGDSFNIPYVTVDAYGHVTGLEEHSITLPEDNDTTYTLSSSAGVISLTPDTGSATTVTFVNGNHTTVAAGANSNEIQINHNAPNATGATEAKPETTIGTSANPTTVSASGIIKVPVVKYDSYGHIVGPLDFQHYQLPVDNNSTYDLGVTAGTATINLTSNDDPTDSVAFTSTGNTIAITATTNSLNFDIEWGSF